MSEGHILERGVDEVMLRALALGGPHARETERVEGRCVLVYAFIIVRWIRRGGDERALRNERPVEERSVLQCFARDRGYAQENG